MFRGSNRKKIDYICNTSCKYEETERAALFPPLVTEVKEKTKLFLLNKLS